MDRRMSAVVDGREFDMRVSSLPATQGERLVIRLLDQGRVHHLCAGGYTMAALRMLRLQVTHPPGLVRMERSSPFRISIVGLVEPRKARVPEVEAEPSTSNWAVGVVVLIPISPVLVTLNLSNPLVNTDKYPAPQAPSLTPCISAKV